mgnify:CR=1 FL=1
MEGIPRLILRLWFHLSSTRRRQLLLSVALMIAGALFDVVSLGAVLPFIAVLVEPDRAFEYGLVADFADIYAMTAPRTLLCQNGLKERPAWFSVPIAREAMKEIKPIYADLKQPDNLFSVAHKGDTKSTCPAC